MQYGRMLFGCETPPDHPIEPLVGKTFDTNFHGVRREVVLLEVRRNKVILQETGHTEKFSLSIKEFTKKYALV